MLDATTLNVELGKRSYPIFIGHNWLAQSGLAMVETVRAQRVLVVSDTHVGELYAERVVKSLADCNFLAESLFIPEGEQFKTLDTCMSIYNFLLSNNYGRDATIIALGGGVVGDIVGFVAATYMRGVTYIQMPTSLLAMVDSSVGGKTGVNHPLGKNMIGAFYQPRMVFIDLACLKTLAEDEFRAGFAEVIKYGVIRAPKFFGFCEKEREAILKLNPKALQYVVKISCSIKADVVSADERESGIRAILNFGHTIGHAIESLTNYSQFKHGEALSIGMVAAGRLALQMGLFDAAQQERLERLLVRSDLPVRIPVRLETDDLLERLRKDKKVLHGRVRFVLPESIGKVIIESEIPHAALKDVLEGMRS